MSLDDTTIPPRDPHAHPDSHPRLSRQAAEILAAFKAAPLHRLDCAQLMTIAQRFGARLYDIRKAGYRIDLVAHDKKTGHTVYELVAP